MATETFRIKRNDTSPTLLYQLDLADGQTLVNATIRFHMNDAAGTSIVDDAGSIYDATEEQIQYAWSAADTVTAGIYNAEFEVTFADGSVETFPNDGYLRVRVYEDLA